MAPLPFTQLRSPRSPSQDTSSIDSRAKPSLQDRNPSPSPSSAPHELADKLQQHSVTLSKRALHTNVIPLSYDLSGANPGATVGITLGAIAGFLLLFWLIWFATLGRPSGLIEGDEITDVHIARRSDRSEHTRRSRRSRRTRQVRSEVSEATRRSPSPRPRRERVVVDTTTRRTERSQPPPQPPMSDVTREHESIFERETERRVEGDDVVEVMEEDSLVSERPKKKSGYRTVDPSEYAGGNFPTREVSRDRRRSSRR